MDAVGGAARRQRAVVQAHGVGHMPVSYTHLDVYKRQALLAGVGAGVYGSVPEACAAVIEYGPAQMPDGERHRRYGEFYDLYRQLYPALKPLYAQLGALA